MRLYWPFLARHRSQRLTWQSSFFGGTRALNNAISRKLFGEAVSQVGVRPTGGREDGGQAAGKQCHYDVVRKQFVSVFSLHPAPALTPYTSPQPTVSMYTTIAWLSFELFVFILPLWIVLTKNCHSFCPYMEVGIYGCEGPETAHYT